MELEKDVLQQYRSISASLKKRFLKKPNIAEGSEQFGSLAKQLRSQDCPQYAGFCHLAQARCEHTLGNAVSEAHLLTEAARSFLQAEKHMQHLRVPSFSEQLNAAINCYSHAIRVHLENNQCNLAACVSVEMGHALKSMGRPDEAIQHYQRAAELQLQTPLDCLMSMSFIASSKLMLDDYEGALGILTEMTYFAHERATPVSSSSFQPIGAYADVLSSCEVLRVLLLLLLQFRLTEENERVSDTSEIAEYIRNINERPTPQRIRPEHAQTLEKYSWENKEESSNPSSHHYLSEEMFLLMQSVVMACQTRDLKSLKALQIDLWSLFTAEQNHLLHLVIAELSQPSGLDS